MNLNINTSTQTNNTPVDPISQRHIYFTYSRPRCSIQTSIGSIVDLLATAQLYTISNTLERLIQAYSTEISITMATNDTHRITKDTSARKQPGFVNLAEHKAQEGYYKILLEGRKEEHEQIERDLKAAHVEEIASITKAHQAEAAKLSAANVQDITTLTRKLDAVQEPLKAKVTSLSEQLDKATKESLEKEKHARQAGEDTARTDCQATIDELNSDVANAKTHIRNLREYYTQRVDSTEQDAAANKTVADAALQDIKDITARKDHEIALLKRQVAIEVKFRCKGGRNRTYLLRPGAKFRDAIEEMCKDLGKSIDSLQFYTSDQPMEQYKKDDWCRTPGIRQITPGNRTVEQVSDLSWIREVGQRLMRVVVAWYQGQG